MAIKTFTAGEVLTASDTNTYLGNSGLVYVSSQTATGTTINVNNLFTSTYDNYRVLIEVTTVGGNVVPVIQMRTSTTNTGGSAYAYSGADFLPGSVSSQGSTGAASWRVAAHSAGVAGMDVIEFYNPYKAVYTGFTSVTQGSYTPDSRFLVMAGGYLANTTSYDGFSWQVGSSCTVTITCFGYRKA